MIRFAQSSLWQRHYVLAQSVTAFHELELKYPAAAAMARSNEINRSPDTGYAFKDGDSFTDLLDSWSRREQLSPEAELVNQTWRDFVKSMCGILAQIWYTSQDEFEDGRSEQVARLRKSGNDVIVMLVSSYWKSFDSYGKYWLYDEDLKALVVSIIHRQSDLQRLENA